MRIQLRKKTFWTLAGGSLLAMSLSFTACGTDVNLQPGGTPSPSGTPSEEPTGQPTEQPAEAQGTAIEINAESQTLVVMGESGDELSLTVNDQTEITMNGESTSLSEIPQDAMVQVTYEQETSLALTIEVEEAQETQANGTVSNVDPQSNSMTLVLESGQELSVTMEEGTEISMEGQTTALANIPEGANVSITYNQSTNVAVTVDVQQVEPVEAEGTITQVNAEDDAFTLQPDAGEALDLKVNDDTQISMNGQELTLGDIGQGAMAHVSYNPVTMVALTVDVADVEPAEAEGSVAEVDPENNSMLVELESGQQVSVSVDEGTQIMVDGHMKALADVPEGAMVNIAYNQVTNIAVSVNVQQPEPVQAEGSAAMVDTENNALGVELEDGSMLSLIVNEDTEVTMEGESLALADIPEDAGVKVSYMATTNIAVSIEVSAPEEPEEEEEGEGEQETVSGTITDFDTGDSRLTIDTNNGDELVIHITDETKITVNGTVGSLENLDSNNTATIVYDQETHEAISITVELHS